jgi:hypothetical protein
MGIVPKRFHCAMSFAAGGECMNFFSGAREKIQGINTSTKTPPDVLEEKVWVFSPVPEKKSIHSPQAAKDMAQ